MSRESLINDLSNPSYQAILTWEEQNKQTNEIIKELKKPYLQKFTKKDGLLPDGKYIIGTTFQGDDSIEVGKTSIIEVVTGESMRYFYGDDCDYEPLTSIWDYYDVLWFIGNEEKPNVNS